MGIVYEAHDPAIDRRVAIKLVRTALLEGEERQDYVERFRREAQAAGRCNHPGIVAIYDFALHEGSPFLAMEYVDGVGLDKALAHGERFPPAAAVHTILQVLEALVCAHALGIVHRDIKPANIILTAGGRIKVTDFGIARVDSSELTHAGMAIGTPSYMSPEQCRGEPVDPRSDLFSVAAVLQEMLIGQRPFPGRSFTEVAYGLLSQPPVGAAELTALAGPALAAVLHRALAKRPEERFASAEAMADALRKALGAAPIPAPPAEAGDRTLIAGLAPETGPAVASPFDQILLGSIERRLAHHVGPIARYLVQTTLRNASSVEDLCEALAQRIDRPDDRREFLSEALEAVRTSASGRAAARHEPPPQSAPGSTIPPEEIERAQRALAETLGPIARILVQRTLSQAQTAPELWDSLAVHIGAAADRAAFLRQRDKR